MDEAENSLSGCGRPYTERQTSHIFSYLWILALILQTWVLQVQEISIQPWDDTLQGRGDRIQWYKWLKDNNGIGRFIWAVG